MLIAAEFYKPDAEDILLYTGTHFDPFQPLLGVKQMYSEIKTVTLTFLHGVFPIDV